MSTSIVHNHRRCLGLLLLLGAGCDGRAVGQPIDLGTVKTGIYSARLLSLDSNCESRGEKARVSVAGETPVVVHRSAGTSVINLPFPLPTFGEVISRFYWRQELSKEQGFAAELERPAECGRSAFVERALLEASDGRVTSWQSERWNDGPESCPGATFQYPGKACTSSVEVEYALRQACESPCTMRGIGAAVDGEEVFTYECACP